MGKYRHVLVFTVSGISGSFFNLRKLFSYYKKSGDAVKELFNFLEFFFFFFFSKMKHLMRHILFRLFSQLFLGIYIGKFLLLRFIAIHFIVGYFFGYETKFLFIYFFAPYELGKLFQNCAFSSAEF